MDSQDFKGQAKGLQRLMDRREWIRTYPDQQYFGRVANEKHEARKPKRLSLSSCSYREDDLAASMGRSCEHFVCEPSSGKRQYFADVGLDAARFQEIANRTQAIGGDRCEKKQGAHAVS